MTQPPSNATDRPSKPLRAPGTTRLASRVPLVLRALAGACLIKVVHLGLETALGPGPLLDRVGIATSALLLMAVGWWAVHLARVARRRFLWRVRRKLLLSYVLIGVVPILLLVAFFVFATFLTLFHISSYLFRKGIDDVVDEAAVIASAVVTDLQRAAAATAPDVLEQRLMNTRDRYPDISLARVPFGPGSPLKPLQAGTWTHDAAPVRLPDWIDGRGFQGLMVVDSAGGGPPHGLVVRAIAPAGPRARWAVVVDLPVDERLADQWRQATGVDLERVNVLRPGPDQTSRADAGSVLARPSSGTSLAFGTVTFFDYVDWATGQSGTLFLSLRVAPAEMYRRLAAVQSRFGDRTVGDIFLMVLGVLGVTFLIIEGVALIMGLALARSITGAIHELSEGTRRVRVGDFGHRIRVLARDQLGELATSFNDMTSSIQDLMREQEEKRRLEEELRIARDIQLSLLPRGAVGFPGVAVSTVCVPAMEVGGDYFDFFRIDEAHVGLLIADVAGKGTFAALYMAELKGLMLSLSRIHSSPRRLLIEVNRILSHTLDGRSFISMTYAVMNLLEGTLVYARAGHTPLIHVTGHHDDRIARRLIPDGIVVGLQHDDAIEKFEAHLSECTLILQSGDVLVLFTDGLTEAMNGELDLFGESRLLALLEQHGHEGMEALRERILSAVAQFRGAAVQHDDMTMILIEIGSQFGAARTVLPAAEPMALKGVPS